ncbi:tax1-binding 1 isoform X1 [Pelobates cultripes]|uniref:Tax1-binding 1 isoform X1 n=1 Tax=Pelobates cultripes TaxID=61616 RepID=A0AAD1RWL4_PELCU|nr:tax1-binding 1 isoform X1 [Pelobates cultripes]
MAALQDVLSPDSTLQASNFAHVIFQNVAKTYLPNAAIECHYTLTQYIQPHQKDWVGIFKVGWSTARDYYTFLWSPMPEKYVAESTCDCVLTFQGYYLPNDDGEFYQFCYVTQNGEIRGASTPFQFRTTSPVDELLTMEDEGHSDMLVVTTKAGLLELKIEKTMKEKEELAKITAVLEKETVQLRQQVELLETELTRKREQYDQLSLEKEEINKTSEGVKAETEELKKKCEAMTSRIHQMEDDIMIVTQKTIAKETELESIRDKLRKVTLDKEHLECQLKNEKDEKELYKVHLKNTEIENTKLLTEVQTLKNLDTSKDNLISHYKEELGKMKLCLAEKEKLQTELLQHSADKDNVFILKQQLRKLEDDHQSSRQSASLMSKELSDAVNIRDRTMADLHTARLETECVKKQLADILSQVSARDVQLPKSTVTPAIKVQMKMDAENAIVEQELRKEVEDLKRRLQMREENYKEKFKECQKLQKQVVKLTEQLKTAESHQKELDLYLNVDTTAEMQHFTPPVSPFLSESVPDFVIKEQVHEMTKEITEKTEKYRKCKQMLTEEKARSSAYADEVAMVELKWKEQLKINESIKLQLAAIEDQYKIQSAEKDKEIMALSHNVEILLNERKKLENDRKELEINLEKLSERAASGQNLASGGQSGGQSLQFYDAYCDEHRAVPIIPVQQPILQFGNPYATQATRDGADGAFKPEDFKALPVGPPARANTWGLEDKVVCSQPARNLSRPDGLEDPDDNSDDDDVIFHLDQDDPSFSGQEQASFCFDPRYAMQKKCPLCSLVFPPNFDQVQFEAHVESHWKVCPMCNEQFPPDCDQQIFEKHVQTHFDGNVLNFD